MKRGSGDRSGLKAFAIYLLVFLLFFLQYPLQNSLTGDLDTVANLAMYKQVALRIDGMINDFVPGTTNYPCENVWMSYGADFGLGFIHLFFNGLGLNDVWANWLFISLIFALNSITLFILARCYVQSIVAAFIAGLLFSFCQFTLGNLENPNTLFFALSFTSLYFYHRYILERKRRHLLLSFSLGAIQVYLVPYVFLLHTIMLGIMVLVYDLQGNNGKRFLKRYISLSLLYFLLIFPYFYYYVLDSPISDHYNPIKALGFTHVYSLNIDDFARVLPNHLLFDFKDQIYFLLIFKLKAAYIGLSFWLSSIAGLFIVKGRARLCLIFIWFAGFILCLGPYVSYNLVQIFPNITWPLYEYLDMGSILRIPARAFFLSIFSMSILTGYFIKYLADQGILGRLCLGVILIFFIAENVPFPMQTYSQNNLLNPDAQVLTLLKEAQPGKKTVLHLPSALFGYDGDKREYTYMYWQSFHGQNILNGGLGFFPPERMENDSLMRTWNSPGHLNKLVEKNKVDYVLYHKDLAEEDVRLNAGAEDLLRYDFLHKKVETERTVIMEVIK